MKKFWINLLLSMVVGGVIAGTLYKIVPGWTRADMFSLFAIIVAVWQAAITRWEAIPVGELAKLQLQREQDDAKRAKIVPELKVNGSGNHALYLINIGRCEARDVRVYLDNSPIEEHQAFMQWGEQKEKVVIGIGSSYSYLLVFDKSCSPPFDLKIQWEDDFQHLNVYSTTLSW